MPSENETLRDFLKDIPDQDKTETDLFGQAPEALPAKEETAEQAEVRQNRRERRGTLARQLDEEREARIRAEAKLEAMNEVKRFSEEAGIDPRLTRLYGTSEEGKEAARLQAEILADMSAKAKEAALDEIRQERARETEEQKKYEGFIDEQLESIEEEHNVDLTSNAPRAQKMRREFLEKVSKLSPKDENGTITGYADFGAVWDEFRATEKAPSRNKEIADRSMAPSGSVDTTKVANDENLAWLRQNGIRV